MIVAVCVDDRGGMCFGGRRVSRDRKQQEDLLELCAPGKLWAAPFSAKLLEWAAERVTVDPEYLEKAGAGDICFVEADGLGNVLERIEGVILYRWNRAYPADQKLDLDLTEFLMMEQVEFPGTSHETITREIYRRKE